MHLFRQRQSDLLERDPVFSQSVATAGYDSAQFVLEVEYYNGLVYRFFGVSRDIAEEIMDPGSFDVVFRRSVVGIFNAERVGFEPAVFLGG